MTPTQAPPTHTVPAHRRGAWVWPLLLALTFATAVGAWLQWTDEQEREDERSTLIADVLSLESRMAVWLGEEDTAIKAIAQHLPAVPSNETLLREPDVAHGLRRLWISVTVVDRDNNLSAHLVTPLPGGGQLIVRFAPSTLLRQTVPWWLSRKYHVQLMDDYGQRIAATDDALPQPGHQSYRVSLDVPMQETYLELTTREVRKAWWRTLPLALMLVFVALSAAASWTLRRQMQEVNSAEHRWRTEAAWRRAIEDSLTVGLRGRDMEGRLVHVNRAFCDLVGLSPEQLLGKLPPMPYWLPDAMEDSMQRHLRNMAGEAPREGYETQWLHSNGSTMDVMMLEAPLIDAQGVQIGWMGSVVDITGRKRSQERERRQLETLGNQARLTTLGEVASALAHQLNQPLAAVASYNAGVLRSLKGQGFQDAVVLQALEREGEQIAAAGRVVQRIRAFLTRRSPQPEPIAVTTLVQRALDLLKHDFQQQAVIVTVRETPGLMRVMADPVLIEQVLINLLRNSMDSLAGQAAPRIHIAASTAGTRFVRVEVDVSGTGLQGLGIDALASPFHTTKPDGMGMGLSICRTIIEAHHGALEAGVSDLGGARLSFTLPVVPLTQESA
ncbi:MAG: PAS domain-containing sensor histidine kinase [Burkholderiales bacterium PBB4]|nr:MAG: PAS domain-containing sensor histidine kinase [Burkholderiales bacterium PBB4]